MKPFSDKYHLQIPKTRKIKTTAQQAQLSPMQESTKNLHQQQKKKVAFKTQSPEKFSNLVDEFKKMGIQTVEISEQNSSNSPKIMKTSHGSPLDPSLLECETSNIMDFSHYAQMLRQPSKTVSIKVNKNYKNKRLQIKEISKKLFSIKSIYNEIKGILKNESIKFQSQIKKIHQKMISAEEYFQKQIKKQKIYSQSLEKSYEKLRQQNKNLKKEIEKASQNKIYRGKQNNFDKEKFDLLKQDYTELQEEIQDLRRVNRSLNNKIDAYDSGKFYNSKSQFTSQKERQMKVSYIKCIQKFSEQISCLENQLFKIKQQSKNGSSIHSRQRQIYERMKQIQEKQKYLWNYEQSLNMREQNVHKEERYSNLEKQRMRIRQKIQNNKEDKIYPVLNVEPKRQVMSPQNIRNHYSPQMHLKRNFQTSRNFRSQYFSPNLQLKHSPSKNSYQGQGHLLVSQRIGKIQNNVRKELDELFKRKNRNYEFN